MEQQKGTPADYVYAGRRNAAKGSTFVHVIYTLTAAGELGDRGVYDGKAFKRDPIIGGIYRGASFDGKTAYGLTSARYIGQQFPDKSREAEWEAADNECRNDAAQERLRKGHVSTVTEAVLPLRKMLHAMRKRGAHHEAHALVTLIQQELYRPMTKTEQEEK